MLGRKERGNARVISELQTFLATREAGRAAAITGSASADDVRSKLGAILTGKSWDYLGDAPAFLKTLEEKLDGVGRISPLKVFLGEFRASLEEVTYRSAGEEHEKEWKAWRWTPATAKDSLRDIYHLASAKFLSDLRTKFRSLQGPKWISPLLLLALSSTGSMSRWNQLCYAENGGETSPLLFDSESDLTPQQVKILVEAGKHGRNQLAVVALHAPAPLPGDPAMRNKAQEWARLREAGLEPWEDSDFVERDALCAADEMFRLASMYALLPQLDSLSTAQAKWLVYASMAAPRCCRNPCAPEFGSFPDLWAVALPANIFAALEELFLEGDFLENEGAETLRLAAAERMSRAGIESPAECKLSAVNAFNRALQIVASQNPGSSEAYHFMNRGEMALFLDLIVDLEATGCIKAVTDMYHRTDGRMVDLSYPNRFSSKKSQPLGLLDFLACMGVQTPRGKDVEQSTKRVRVNYELSGEMLAKLQSDPNGFDAWRNVLMGQEDRNDAPIDPSVAEMIHQARQEACSSHFAQVDERLDTMARSAEGVSARAASCAQCGFDSDTTMLLRCARCKGVWYCDAACQKLHWVSKIVLEGRAQGSLQASQVAQVTQVTQVAQVTQGAVSRRSALRQRGGHPPLCSRCLGKPRSGRRVGGSPDLQVDLCPVLPRRPAPHFVSCCSFAKNILFILFLYKLNVGSGFPLASTRSRSMRNRLAKNRVSGAAPSSWARQPLKRTFQRTAGSRT